MVTNKWLAGFLLCALIVAAPHGMASRDGYYRWVDDGGTVHFSQKPPQGRTSQFISTRGGRYLPEDRDGQAQVEQEQAATPSPGQPQQPQQPAPEFVEVLPEQDPEECQRAREMLTALGNNTVRMRLVGEDGQPRLITPEERAEQRERAEQAVELHCD